ncbi:MAG: hypothetical protein HYY02_01070 [Chloroflexi bacterium]|nr:hypothetical protein [Chloroflexota bacterium]
MRAHVVLPEDLIREIDRTAGKRRRSQFVEAAIREKLVREALGRALEETAGILDLRDHPEWDTPEKISAWVRASREEDDAALERKLGRLNG